MKSECLCQANSAGVLAEIAEERLRQEGLGFTAGHDDAHGKGELATAAAHYAIAAGMALWLGKGARPEKGGPIAKMPRSWPWERKWWKPGPVRRMLIKAAALIVAEIERLDRVSAATSQPQSTGAVEL